MPQVILSHQADYPCPTHMSTFFIILQQVHRLALLDIVIRLGMRTLGVFSPPSLLLLCSAIKTEDRICDCDELIVWLMSQGSSILAEHVYVFDWEIGIKWLLGLNVVRQIMEYDIRQ